MLGNSKKAPASFDDEIIYTTYSRVSTDKLEQKISSRFQKEFVNQIGKNMIAEYRSWKHYDMDFSDDGVTGTNAVKREGFQKMVEIAEQRDTFNLIIIRDVSRFARNKVDFLNYLKRLEDSGVAVYFEGFNFFSTDHKNADIILTMLSIIAEQESRNKREYTMQAHKARRDLGYVFGADDKFGYDMIQTPKGESNKLVVCKRNKKTGMNEAKIVKLIFDLYTGRKILDTKYKRERDGGYGNRQIIKYLNEQGYKTKKGQAWSNVANILSNKTYCGYVRYNTSFKSELFAERSKQRNKSEYLYIKSDNVEQLITEEQFELVQKIALMRQTYQQKPQYDEDGNVMYDEFGNMLLEYHEVLLDDDGNPKYDDKGHPIYKNKGYRTSYDTYAQVLQCECKSTMKHHKIRRANKDGKRPRGYTCLNHDRGQGCKNTTFNRVKLDMLTWKIYKSIWCDQREIYEELYKIIEHNIKVKRENSNFEEELENYNTDLQWINKKIKALMDDKYNPDIKVDIETFNALYTEYKRDKQKYELEIARLNDLIDERDKAPVDIMESIKNVFKTNFVETLEETYEYKVVADEFVHQVVDRIVSHADGSFDYYINLTGVNRHLYKNKFDENYSNRYVLPTNTVFADTIEIPYDEAQAFVKTFKKHGFYKKDWKPLIARIYVTI